MRIAGPWTALACLVLAAGCQERHPAPVATPPPVVEVARPVRREVTDFDVFTARTEAVQSVNVKARVTGYLTKILFKDGEDVKENQVLFEIDDRPYKAALDKAKGDAEVARAALARAQAFYDIGLKVQMNDASAISTQELDKRKGARDEAAGNVEQCQGVLDNARLNYGWCKVAAPVAGRTDRHFLDVGNLVTENVTPLTNIVSLKPTWAYFDVDQNTAEDHRRLVREGKIKSARANEIPAQLSRNIAEGFPINGFVDFVSNQLDPNTGSIRLRAVFPNDDERLLAGLFVRIRVPATAPHEALLVSNRAVGTDQGGKFILALNDRNVVESRIVEVGRVHDGLREVLPTRTILETDAQGKQTTWQVEVLRTTDRVLVNGLQRVRPGDTVAPRLVDMVTGLPVADADTSPERQRRDPGGPAPSDKPK